MKDLYISALLTLSLCALLEAQCTTIQQGVLVYQSGHHLAGQPLKPGFDIFGYNYQAHLFNGSYANVYIGRDGFPPYTGDDASYLAQLTPAQQAAVQGTWYWPYRRDTVSMKWNDAWLSNKDCDSDGLLDRHYGFPSYIGSGAWETNHMSGDTLSDGTEIPHWTYFVKIVAVPSSATKVSGVWHSADGTEIGLDIWGEFAIIQEVYNDPSAGAHGILYKSPLNAGFGYYKP